MKGLEIFFRGKTIHLAPNFSMGVFAYNRNGHYRIQVSGLDENMISYFWLDSEMELGKVLEIEIKNIDKSSEPESTKVAFSNPVVATEKEIEVINTERLDYFFALEKILKEENLL